MPLSIELDAISAMTTYLTSSISASKRARKLITTKLKNTPPIKFPAKGSANINVGIMKSVIPIKLQATTSIRNVNFINLGISVIIKSKITIIIMRICPLL